MREEAAEAAAAAAVAAVVAAVVVAVVVAVAGSDVWGEMQCERGSGFRSHQLSPWTMYHFLMNTYAALAPERAHVQAQAQTQTQAQKNTSNQINTSRKQPQTQTD